MFVNKGWGSGYVRFSPLETETSTFPRENVASGKHLHRLPRLLCQCVWLRVKGAAHVPLAFWWKNAWAAQKKEWKPCCCSVFTVLSGKGGSEAKVCQVSTPAWAACEKGFRANGKSHQAQNVSFPFQAVCNKSKRSAQVGVEGGRLSFALYSRDWLLNIWPGWRRPVVSNPLPAWLQAGLFHKLSLLLKTVPSTLGFSVFWFELPILSWWSFAACKG